MSKMKVIGWLAILMFIIPALAQEDQVDYTEMSLEDLLNVEVTTAGKKAQKINEIPASVVVLNRAEIEHYGYQTLNDILEHITGLYGIDQRGVDGEKFGVRGFYTSTATSIIYLINGVRQVPMPGDGAAYMNNRVPTESIDRIEVVRGPMSVNYGSGAFFGVINIITNENRGEKGNQNTIAAGNKGTQSVTTRTGLETGELKTILSAGYRTTDGEDIPYSRMSTYDLATDYGVESLTTEDKWGERNIFINSSTTYGEYYANFNYDHVTKGGELFIPSTRDGIVTRRAYMSFSAGRTKKYSDKFSLDTKATYHYGAAAGKWDWFTPPTDPNLNGDENELEDLEIDITAFYNASDRVEFTAGAYYKKIMKEELATITPQIDFIYRLGTTTAPINQALYVQADIKATERLQFVVGGRADQARKYGTYYRIFAAEQETVYGEYTHDSVEFLPRFAAIFKANEKNIVKLLYGKAINHPLTFQNAAQAFTGNTALNPEFIETIELNYLWVGSKLTANVSLFQNALDALIINDFVNVDGNLVGVNRNAGKIDTEGAELSIQAKPTDWWSIDLSGMYQKSDDKSETYGAYDVPYSPEVLGYLKTHFSLSSTVGLGLTGRYVSSMKPLYDVTADARIAPDSDSYFSLGANLRFDNVFGDYYVQVSGANITDKEYLYPATSLQILWANLGTAGNSRSFQLTVGKKF